MSSLRSAFDSPAAKRRYVRRLFATIADRYDLITPLLSYGRDRRWKARLTDLALRPACAERVRPSTLSGSTVSGDEPSTGSGRTSGSAQGKPAGGSLAALDLACGTGDIAYALAARGARVAGLDLVPRMVALARAKSLVACPGPSGTDRDRPPARSRPPGFLVGDMMALPFPVASFDLVTTGYGLRNVPVLETALAEIHRVLRPGGRLLSLDFARPVNAVVRSVYLTYLTVVGSLLGLALHGDADTYRYIAASLQWYPGASAVADRMQAVGFAEAGYLPLLGGLMAINHATK